MLDFYQALATELTRQPVALATVIDVKGSVPREVGAKMIVCADGRQMGTIGGGAGEAKVYQAAQQVLQSGVKTLVEIDLSGVASRDTQGVCGGVMHVWVERWPTTTLALVQEIILALEHNQAIALITPFDLAQSPHLQPNSRDTIEVTATHLIEPLHPLPTLLIIGGGHVAIPLAEIASLAGFAVIVTDDRPEFATPERFPKARQVWPTPVTTALAALPLSPLYVALVTRGLAQDIAALQALVTYPTRYIGMIGSQKRVQLVRQALIEAGIAAQLPPLYAPIGLDIGALTPAEIAVSITAELIQVRRGGSGRPLSRSPDAR